MRLSDDSVNDVQLIARDWLVACFSSLRYGVVRHRRCVCGGAFSALIALNVLRRRDEGDTVDEDGIS